MGGWETDTQPHTHIHTRTHTQISKDKERRKDRVVFVRNGIGDVNKETIQAWIKATGWYQFDLFGHPLAYVSPL